MSDALLRRMRKIMELAKRGVGGEQAAAESMLANLMAKHGITLDDLGGDAVERHWHEFSFSSAQEGTILAQCVFRVRGTGEVSIKRRPKSRSKVYHELSRAEHAQVVLMYAILRKAWAEEVDKLETAFIHINRLYSKTERTDDEPAPERTPEEAARMKQIAAMMMAMPKANLHVAIEGGE